MVMNLWQSSHLRLLGIATGILIGMLAISACGGEKVDEATLPTKVAPLQVEPIVIVSTTEAATVVPTDTNEPTNTVAPSTDKPIAEAVEPTYTATEAVSASQSIVDSSLVGETQPLSPLATTVLTPTLTPLPTETATVTPTLTLTPTVKLLPTATLTPTKTSTAIPTATPTLTTTQAQTATATMTLSVSATLTPTTRATLTATLVATPTLSTTATLVTTSTVPITSVQPITRQLIPTETTMITATQPVSATTPITTGVELEATGEYAGLPNDVANMMKTADVGRGQLLTQKSACTACHNFDPAVKGVGPSWLNVADIAATRVPTQTAVVYLYNSIVNPNEYVVEGYAAGLMLQNLNDVLSPQDKADVLTYLLTLRKE